jgi:hypothetical protein
MLAVIATGSVLLVIATSAVHRAMRLDSQWRAQANVSRGLTRLAHDFRADVHECQDTQLAEDSTTLKLTSADGMVVTYEIAADEIIRDVQTPGAERRREFYTKPADYGARFSIQDEPHWVELHVTHDPLLKGIAPRVALHVEVEAGRFARLAQNLEDTP